MKICRQTKTGLGESLAHAIPDEEVREHFAQSEVETADKEVKIEKEAGLDGIYSEFLKHASLVTICYHCC